MTVTMSLFTSSQADSIKVTFAFHVNFASFFFVSWQTGPYRRQYSDLSVNHQGSNFLLNETHLYCHRNKNSFKTAKSEGSNLLEVSGLHKLGRRG